jgi:hypothetical protein
MVGADSWFRDSKLMRHVTKVHRALWWYRANAPIPLPLKTVARSKSDLVKVDNWAWKRSLHAPGCRYVRLRTHRRTYGHVLLIGVDKPGEKPFYLISMSLTTPVTRRIRAWTQRHWIEQRFRLLKHLLATEACQARSEDADYGHFVLRLIAGFALFYTSRFIFKGHVTMEEMVFTLKHSWRTVDYEPFDLYAIA